MSDDRKDLPPASAPNYNERIRETLQVYLGLRGDKLDRGVTLRDLSDAKLIVLDRGFLAGTGGRGSPIAGPGTAVGVGTGVGTEPDLTPPPTPTGFAATTSRTSIQIVTDRQTYAQGHGHAKTQVFGAKYSGTALTFANAVLLDEFSGDVHAFPVDPASDYRLWVKWVTVDGEVSPPAGGTNGVTATAGLLDDTNITSLTVSKLRSGSLSVGQYAQSSSYVAGSAGWRIDGAGLAEFSNVVVRGTVYATTGLVGGVTIASNALSAGQTAYNTGSGFYLGSDGKFSLGSSAGNRLTWDGSSLNVVGGGTFSGALSAATGTFAGSLSAATGTFAGSLSAATGSFSGSLSAATGSFAGSLSAATGSFSGSLTANAINAVNTINIAGNAVTSSNAVTGTGSCSTTITIPSGQNGWVTAVAMSSPGPTQFFGSGVTPSATLTLTIAGQPQTNNLDYTYQYTTGGNGSAQRSNLATVTNAIYLGVGTHTVSFSSQASAPVVLTAFVGIR